VTAATITPDNRWVAVRTYRTLYLYPLRELTAAGETSRFTYDLTGFDQAQGESIAVADDGSVWMTSEAERRGARPSWIQLHCPLPDPT
jgi:hypothetical protein